MTMDMFWSWFAMPIGLMICFGPLVVVWLIKEFGTKPSDEEE